MTALYAGAPHVDALAAWARRLNYATVVLYVIKVSDEAICIDDSLRDQVFVLKKLIDLIC